MWIGSVSHACCNTFTAVEFKMDLFLPFLPMLSPPGITPHHHHNPQVIIAVVVLVVVSSNNNNNNNKAYNCNIKQIS